MEQYFSLLGKNPLFASVGEENLSSMLTCLEAKVQAVPKDSYALRAGEKPETIGVLLEGKLQITREDAEGNRALLAVLMPGDFYGETLVCAGVPQSPVSILALSPSKILRLDVRKLITVCSHACLFHTTVIRNLVWVMARKNLHLQSRMEVLDQKSIRDRILLYLSMQEKKHGEAFTVPFNRNELADYLAVDRSALSRELGRLRDEGALDFHKNQFTLH